MKLEFEKEISVYDGPFELDNILREYLYNKKDDKDTDDKDSSLCICDLSDIVRKYIDWNAKMPRVKPFYAVKCNNHDNIIKLLAQLGTGFDCASPAEIDSVIKYGVTPERIIFANSVKPPSHLRHAIATNVNLMTFDSTAELDRIHSIYPQAQLVLRIRCDAKKATVIFGEKFGCDPNVEAPRLLEYAKNLNLNIVGISFHVGSSCMEPMVFARAIAAARGVFNYALSLGFNMSLLDIGGGIPGRLGWDLNVYAKHINSALMDYFPMAEFPTLQIISEPGTYFVESSCFTAVTIFSKSECLNANNEVQHVKYYINDSIYGSFYSMSKAYGKIIIPRILSHSNEENLTDDNQIGCTIYGQSMDGYDKISDLTLPNMKIGDVLIYPDMGAYSNFVMGRAFNGFPLPKVKFFADNETMKILLRI